MYTTAVTVLVTTGLLIYLVTSFIEELRNHYNGNDRDQE